MLDVIRKIVSCDSFVAFCIYRDASGEDAAKKKPVDSEKDALRSRKQMEESRQVV